MVRVGISAGARALALALALGACERREENQRCTDALLSGKAEAAHGDVGAARASLERARAACPEGRKFYVDRLEGDLHAAEESAARKAHDEALETAKRRDPLERFVSWIAARRNDSDRSSPRTTCADRSAPDYGFCSVPAPDGDAGVLRYWKDGAQAFAFEAKLPAAVTCLELGEHRLVRDWSKDGERLVYCEFTRAPLNELSALIRRSGEESSIIVFSREWLARSAATREAIESAR